MEKGVKSSLSPAIDPKYDVWRSLIDRKRSSGISWKKISEIGTEDGLENLSELASFPRITVSQWEEILDAKKDAEVKELNTEDDAVLGNDIDSEIRISSSINSSWQIYKKHLMNKGFGEKSINSIEKSSLSILKKISRNTENREDGAVKGLVTGHVQSGKTANISGLMAIGADNGYNMFIILSGTIEKLRLQTQQRLYEDLNDIEGMPNLKWRFIDRPNLNSSAGERMSDLRLNDIDRFFSVCLKNTKRLNDLYKWIIHDKNKLQQLKLIVIDDEGDQASVNTGKTALKERKVINNLIVKLTEIDALAVNYIAFTATPYANFLNEAYPESLYPKDFVAALPQSDEHFGPEQIFGLMNTDSEGLDIIRYIEDREVDQIIKIHSSEDLELPVSLKKAICWFICTAAVRRFQKTESPVSMLIHTSQKVFHHQNIGEAVKNWLGNKRDEIAEICKEVWEEETASFTLKDFKKQFGSYSLINSIEDYPNYGDIFPFIEVLIDWISHIPLSEEGIIQYHKGIHICVDNSANNYAEEDSQYKRLLYPSKELKDTGRIIALPDYAAAFIVIGGSTLSRGLTLEGLTSTFFLRDSKQIDTLMQMGRWFGYRRGYELLPRIWMTPETRYKFDFMTSVEYELREELKNYMRPPCVSPKFYGPKVKNTPSLTWLRPTSKNKMQNIQPVDLDFSGANTQTTMFHINQDILKNNLAEANTFLNSLGEPNKNKSSVLVWENIDFERIKTFLSNVDFHERLSFFNSINTFIEWYNKVKQKAEYSNWNVIAAGTDNKREESWKIGKYSIGKVFRSRLRRNLSDNSAAIGALRAPRDLLADTDHYGKITKTLRATEVSSLRKQAGLEKTPQMIIYRISKNSKANDSGKKTNRADMNTTEDLIGLNIWIPGVRRRNGDPNFAENLQVRIPASLSFEADVDTEE